MRIQCDGCNQEYDIDLRTITAYGLPTSRSLGCGPPSNARACAEVPVPLRCCVGYAIASRERTIFAASFRKARNASLLVLRNKWVVESSGSHRNHDPKSNRGVRSGGGSSTPVRHRALLAVRLQRSFCATNDLSCGRWNVLIRVIAASREWSFFSVVCPSAVKIPPQA
jgi:hypothetical protein